MERNQKMSIGTLSIKAADLSILIGGFQVGGVGGHRAVNGTAWAYISQ
jgi:hypothetical protein